MATAKFPKDIHLVKVEKSSHHIININNLYKDTIANEKQNYVEAILQSQENIGDECDSNNEESEDEDDSKLYCICRKPNTGEAYICCDLCGIWLHYHCAGLDTETDVS